MFTVLSSIPGTAKNNKRREPGIVEHAYNPRTREAEAGGLRAPGKPGL
jgi:hypothetical protein